MVRSSVTVNIAGGFETRPIAVLVQLASQYQSRIHLISGSKSVNAKSIMGMMTLVIDSGESITVTADGADEEEALKTITNYLEQLA